MVIKAAMISIWMNHLTHQASLENHHTYNGFNFLDSGFETCFAPSPCRCVGCTHLKSRFGTISRKESNVTMCDLLAS